jgi:tetratricopeptide (TPR) repeat protein
METCATMFGLGWLAIRQAQEALKNGRLEEAQRLLGQPAVQGHKRSWELLQQLARGFAERGERHLRRDDPVAAWNDLLQAEQVGAEEQLTVRLRQALVRGGLAEARSLLDAGEPARAIEAIAQLRDRAVRQPELEPLGEAARGWVQALELSARGEFSQALQALDRVRRLLPAPLTALEKLRNDLEQQAQKFSGLLSQLHEAVKRRDWHEVMQIAEQTLAIAPNHGEARKARAQAWKAIEPTTILRPRHQPGREPAEASEVGHAAQAAQVAQQEQSKRFLLWIDGVGGYLVCLGNRVTVGQAVPDATVDVPIFADVSRLHATLTRDTEGYLLEASRTIQVNGQPVTRSLLHAGDRVTLGSCCQFQFHQPVPISASARLDLVSGHRLKLAVDAVLLMADTLVLGPGPQTHVVMPDLEQPVILFRAKEGLGIRCAGKMSIDGHSCLQRGTLGPTSTVAGDDFTLAVEPVGLRMGRGV